MVVRLDAPVSPEEIARIPAVKAEDTDQRGL